MPMSRAYLKCFGTERTYSKFGYASIFLINFLYIMVRNARSHWPCSLRCGSAAARFLKLQVRIPLATWISSVSVCVVRQRSLWRVDPSSREVLSRLCVCACVHVFVCVPPSVNRCNNNPLHLKRVGRRGQNKKDRKKESCGSKQNDLSPLLFLCSVTYP